jgi:hypothetical protein
MKKLIFSLFLYSISYLTYSQTIPPVIGDPWESFLVPSAYEIGRDAAIMNNTLFFRGTGQTSGNGRIYYMDTTGAYSSINYIGTSSYFAMGSIYSINSKVFGNNASTNAATSNRQLLEFSTVTDSVYLRASNYNYRFANSNISQDTVVAFDIIAGGTRISRTTDGINFAPIDTIPQYITHSFVINNTIWIGASSTNWSTTSYPAGTLSSNKMGIYRMGFSSVNAIKEVEDITGQGKVKWCRNFAVVGETYYVCLSSPDTMGRGIWKRDPITKNWTKLYLPLFSDKQYISMASDEIDNLFIGTTNPLGSSDSSKNKVYSYNISSKKIVSFPPLTSIIIGYNNPTNLFYLKNINKLIAFSGGSGVTEVMNDATGIYGTVKPYNTRPSFFIFTPPTPVIKIETPLKDDVYNLESSQDSIEVTWSSNYPDSTYLYFVSKYFIDTVIVKGTTSFTYEIKNDFSCNLHIIAKIAGKQVQDSITVYILGLRSLEIDTVYVEKEKLNIINGGKLNLNFIANKTSTSFGDVLTIKSISTGIDTINFYIEQENGVWYYLGKKEADTTQTPNITYFTYNLKDNSLICPCTEIGAKERGGIDSDKEGDVSNPFVPLTEFAFEEDFEEKQAFLSISGPFSAHPYKNVMCNNWIGTAWDLKYIVDVSCGWVASWGEDDCKEGYNSITGISNNKANYSKTSSEEFLNNTYTYKQFITSGAFTYSISEYIITLTSILTGQSKTFDMKKLDILGGGFFAGGSGAIHPPYAIDKRNFGGDSYLLVGTHSTGKLINPYRDEKPPGVIYTLGITNASGPPLFYMFKMDSRFAYTLIQHRGSFKPVWDTYDGGIGKNGGTSINSKKTKYRGIHSIDGIWKYGNPQGIKL